MSFLSFAEAHGLQINSLYPADRVQRCSTVDKPRSRNGAYFWDGERGWVSDWAQGSEINWFEGGKTRELTLEDRRDWARRKQAMELRQEQGWKNSALAAAILLRSTKPAEHNYLHFKGLGQMLGLVTESGELVIPMRNFSTNELQGAQIVKWLPEEMRYEKKMLPGMRAKGTVLRLGPRTAFETIFCEGYATGLSIELAARQLRLSMAVLICFSDSNMAHVASMFKGSAYCFADNDRSGAGQRAAEKAGLPFCMSDIEGNDANDDHKQLGLMAVCRKLMDVRALKRLAA